MQREPSSTLGTCVGHAGLLQHTQLISHCSQLLYCSRFWDVVFSCQNGEHVHANRAFLAARSEFFRGLLFGGLQESHLAEIALPKVKAAPLRLVLHFLHTLEVKSTDASEMMEACELARQYNISECENSLLQQLRDQTVLNGNAISVILDRASALSMPQLELLALEKCSSMLINPSAFLGFSPSALHLCLSAAHLKASETSVLEAVIRWGKRQLCNNPNLALKWVLADILPKLRLESIPADTLQQMVHGLDLLSPEDIAAVRFSQTAQQQQPGLSRQYVRRPWGELGPDIACTDIDTIEFKSQQHQGARSRHCLKAGTGCYVWHLSVDQYSSCTWIGLVDDTADMSRQAPQTGVI
ncbi:TPA: BTB/POZ domain-containing protein 9 [Trebouxia sp. C0004]